jgi:hypothetical protein
MVALRKNVRMSPEGYIPKKDCKNTEVGDIIKAIFIFFIKFSSGSSRPQNAFKFACSCAALKFP